MKTCDELVIELEEQRRLQQQLRQQQQQVEEAQPRPVSLYDFIDLIQSGTPTFQKKQATKFCGLL